MHIAQNLVNNLGTTSNAVESIKKRNSDQKNELSNRDRSSDPLFSEHEFSNSNIVSEDDVPHFTISNISNVNDIKF
jgi:hypothetical protein